MWIFGYGSLMWRPAFSYQERRPAVLHGWARRFWQGSTDHRGVPGAPGRVVTLIEAPTESVTGLAYRIADGDVPTVVDILDYREKGGYERRTVELVTDDAENPRIESLLYVATPANAEFLGAASPTEMARQIARSAGPSGSNADYLRKLATSLRTIGATDPHVFELEALLT